MKILCFLFIIVFHNYGICQDLQFDLKGEAQYTLVKEDLSAKTLFKRVHNYIKESYANNSPCIVLLDSLNYKIKIEESMYDVLARQPHLSRRPLVDSYYNMEISFSDSKVQFNFKHLYFQTSNLEYYLPYENLINKVKDPMIYNFEDEYFNENFEGLIKTYDYYIDNKIVKQFSADMEHPLYWNGSINFDSGGQSQEIILNFDGLSEQSIYDRLISFIQKYYFRPTADYDLNNKKIKVNGSIFDVFFYRAYTPRERFISSTYEMNISIKESTVKLIFFHKGLRQDFNPYRAISFNDILNSKEPRMVEHKQSFLKSYNNFISSIKYYIDTLEMKV